MTDYARDAKNRFQMHLPWSPGASMSTNQVAAILDCSNETVRRMLECGELEGYQLRRKPGSPWRIYKESVVKLLKDIREDNALTAVRPSATPATSANPKTPDSR